MSVNLNFSKPGPPALANLCENSYGCTLNITDSVTVNADSLPNGGSAWDWAVTFTKSFFTFSGGPGNVPTCAGQTLKSIGNELLPGAATGVTASGEMALKAASMKQAAQAAAYAAGRPNSLGGIGLLCNNCSSVFRSMMSKSQLLGQASEALPVAEVGIASARSIPEVAEQARNGACAAAFAIF